MNGPCGARCLKEVVKSSTRKILSPWCCPQGSAVVKTYLIFVNNDFM